MGQSIVIVPKRMALGEPPKKRLCVDYRVINSLLPKVNKAHSKAKGVLTLVPLPKIDEIYAMLKVLEYTQASMHEVGITIWDFLSKQGLNLLL